MILDKFRSNNINEEVEKIKISDHERRELFIQRFIPFIIKSITLVTHSYVNLDNDEEFSIGLEAFNEAIDKYDKSKGKFLNFSQLIIKNKIIDHLRKEQSYRTVLMDNTKIKEVVENVHISSKDISDNLEIKEQILTLKSKLEEFNITFSELTSKSPKHIDTRLNCIKAAKTIINNHDILNKVYAKKVIPVNQMIDLGFTKKFLKRNRKFIIATTIILDSELDYIKDYVYMVEGNGNSDL